MTLSEHLNAFYQRYNIPANGGVADKTFVVPFPHFKLVLPNFSCRKHMLYIHDLEHILHNQDTTWRGEMYIASWEISTGFYKHFPLIVFPLWTMGWGLWKHPRAVLNGFRKGNSDRGIASLNLPKTELLQMTLKQLQALTQGNGSKMSSPLFVLKFIAWSVCSQLLFLMPFLLLFTALFFANIV